MRSPRTATKSSPHSPQLEKARAHQWRANAAKNKQINKINFFKKPPLTIIHHHGLIFFQDYSVYNTHHQCMSTNGPTFLHLALQHRKHQYYKHWGKYEYTAFITSCLIKWNHLLKNFYLAAKITINFIHSSTKYLWDTYHVLDTIWVTNSPIYQVRMVSVWFISSKWQTGT